MSDHFDIPLSTPHLSGRERHYLEQAIGSNWIAPLGPQVEAFEREFAAAIGSRHAVALSSGTAALHLALELAGVRPGDEVIVSTFTFVASVNPISYLGARPILVDSEERSWNLDPNLLQQELEDRARRNRLPRAVVAVHLYGQTADLRPILAACDRWGIPLIEDAAEALGATYWGANAGTLGSIGMYSFNGNKIITTSGGGMLVSADGALIARARSLASQARDPAPHYQHSEVGYNYRLSNLLAAVGRGQLEVLGERVEQRRKVFERYSALLGHLPGLTLMPEAPWGRHTRWLTALTIDPAAFGGDRETVREALRQARIEARPLWKPMHLQPLYMGCPIIGGSVAERLFDRGLCLPSSSSLTTGEIERVAEVVSDAAEASSRPALAGARNHAVA